MAIKKVNSSMVWAVDYDAKTQTLEIAYKRTGVYRYFHVPPAEYRSLIKAESIGSYVRSCIIGVYRETRVD